MVAEVHNLIRQRDILFKRLEVAESMRAFISHRMSSIEELYAKLEQVKSDLVAAQKAATDGAEALKMAEGEKEAAQAKAERMKRESEATEAKCQEAE